jgi:hypothetical protein
MSQTNDKRVIHLSDLQPEPIDWIVPAMFAAGKLSLIDGDPSQGKSLLTLDLASRLTTARPLPTGYTPAQPIHVVVVASEDGLRDTVLPRLQAAQADLRFVHTFVGRSATGAWNRVPTFPADCGLLEETIRETSARLVILDPLAPLLGVSIVHEQAVRSGLVPLAQVAGDTHAAVVMVRNLNKSARGERAIYRGSGSIALIATARTAFLVGQAPEDDGLRVLACTKNNLAAFPPALAFRVTGLEGCPVIDWCGPVDLTADDLVLVPARRHGEAIQEAKDFLTTLLRDGPCPSQEIYRRAHEAGIAERTLRRAGKSLNLDAQELHQDGRNGWYWSLPHQAGAEPWPERHQRELAAAQEQSLQFLADLRHQHGTAGFT